MHPCTYRSMFLFYRCKSQRFLRSSCRSSLSGPSLPSLPGAVWGLPGWLLFSAFSALISSVLASNRLYSSLGMLWDVTGYLQGKRLLHCVRRCESIMYIHTDTLLHILCSGLMIMIYHIYMWYMLIVVVVYMYV